MIQYQTEQTVSDATYAQAGQQTSFHYQMANLRAHKIVTLIKFSKLSYPLEEVADDQDRPYLLRTKQGELYGEYQIISYIINDSFFKTDKIHKQTMSRDGSGDSTKTNSYHPSSLCGKDIFGWAKMNEQLYQLRRTLFPLLEEYYRCLLGHDLLKKSRYTALGNQIRREIMKLDQTMTEHPEIFEHEDSFLNIIIACELFMGCKFAFQEKFRKSKSTLFNLCDQIYKRGEFEDVYGKFSYCVKEFLPVQFQEEDILDTNRAEEIISEQILKLVESNIQIGEKRNELLYNFFRNNLKGQSSKINYFPYFWLMFDNLQCVLVELEYDSMNQETLYQELEIKMGLAKQQLLKILQTSVDYGFLGIYQSEKKRNYRLKVFLCLGSCPYQDFVNTITINSQLRQFKAAKFQSNRQHERRRVQQLWQYQTEGARFSGVRIALLQEL